MTGNYHPKPNELMIIFIEEVNLLWPMRRLMTKDNLKETQKGT